MCNTESGIWQFFLREGENQLAQLKTRVLSEFKFAIREAIYGYKICDDNELRCIIKSIKKTFVSSINSKCTKVTLHLDNSLNSLALLIACLESGFSILLLPSTYPVDSMMQFSHQFGANYIIDYLEAAPRIRNLLTQPEKTSVDVIKIGILTSGSTGKRKCVIHTIESLVHGIVVNDDYILHRWLLGYPLTSFAGLQVFWQAWLCGGSLVIPESFNIRGVIKCLQQHTVDFINCTPTFMRQILQFVDPINLAKVKRVILGGEVVDQSLIDLIKKIMPKASLTHIYATTETGVVIRVKDEKAGFERKLLDNNRLRIIDNELCVKRSHRSMQGYLTNFSGYDDEWIRTGDLVKQNGDRIFFCGRRDDILNIGGNKVNLQYIEAIICKNPLIVDAMVTAIKNPLSGHVLKAEVMILPEVNRNQLQKELIASLAQELPDYMVPRWISVVEELTAPGSFKKKARGINHV